MPQPPTPIRVVLWEGGDAGPLPASDRLAVIRGLLEQGFRVATTQTAPLPHASNGDPVLFAGRSPQPPSDPAFAPPAPHRRWHALNDSPHAALMSAAENLRAEADAPAPGAWLPWFPVIDYDRCTNCMQCLSFCLFGVYGVDPAGRIQAQQQDNCKTHCPACSRVCPEAAIMFPKYKSGPINGDVVSDADLQREKMKIDISALLGGDVYSLLRDRSERARSRFSKERDADKALVERQKCLNKLGEIVADLPPEVLSSLPSAEEIARRAAEAKARTLAAQSTQTAPSTSLPNPFPGS